MAVDRNATDAAALRDDALEALKLHNAGNHTEALARAVGLARAHPGSALALNLVGSLHRHAGVASWTSSAGDETDASALDWRHRSASLGAFSAAAKLAPTCLVTALALAKALAACHRYGDAQIQLCRALMMTETGQADPAVHNVGYDLVCGSTEKARRHEAMAEARVFMKRFAKTICNDVVPREAVELLDGNSLVGLAGARTRERAQFLSRCYPYCGRAQLFLAYIDLAQVRSLDLHTDKKRLLRRTLGIASEAAGTFDRSLVISLFHAKMLFVLDEFDAAERECRRALSIETPNDPNEDDIPPVSVSGPDYSARVCNVRKQLNLLLKQIISVAAKFWCSMISAPHQERIMSLKGSEVIIPLARSYQWIEIKRAITHAVNAQGRGIGDSDIDAIFGKTLASIDGKVSVQNGAPSQGYNIEHQNGDNPRIKNLKTSHSEETLRDVAKCKESEVHAKGCSIVNQRSSDPSIDVHENKTELDKDGTSGQTVEENPGTSSYQPTVNAVNNKNPDNELFILRLIIQSLRSLRHYRVKFLTEPLAWSPSVDNPCSAHICSEVCEASMMNNDMADSTPARNKHMKNLLVDTTVGRIKCRANLNESCISLKHSIQKKIGLAVDHFTLRFRGQVLDRMKTLGSYGIADNSILELNPKLLGGANQPAQQAELETLLDYRRGPTILVQTFQIPSTEIPNATQDTDELTCLGRRLGRSLVEEFVAAWRMNLSFDGKVKEKHVRIRDGRAEIAKEPTQRLTRANWKNDCTTLSTILRNI